MEGVSATVCKGIKSYWKRRGYHRLAGAPSRRQTSRAELGKSNSNSNRKRRFWKIKITSRLKLSFKFSPRKFLIGLRDAYVRMMMRIANTSIVHSGGIGLGSGLYGGNAISEFGLRPSSSLPERSLMVSRRRFSMVWLRKDGTWSGIWGRIWSLFIRGLEEEVVEIGENVCRKL